MAKHRTNAKRNSRKKVKERYAKAREDAQTAGVIPTTPEGAVRPEVVDPVTQGEQDLTVLERIAVRSGWAVPEDKKPVLVDKMVAVVENAPRALARVLAFKALTSADKDQYNRDHPELARGSRGGATNIVNVNGSAGGLLGDLKVILDEVDRETTDPPPVRLLEESKVEPSDGVQDLVPQDGGGVEDPVAERDVLRQAEGSD